MNYVKALKDALTYELSADGRYELLNSKLFNMNCGLQTTCDSVLLRNGIGLQSNPMEGSSSTNVFSLW